MMKKINVRINGKVLRIKDCRGIASLRGLMFDSMNKCDGALIYGNSIWMPFVKRGLELIFLDRNCKVMEIQHAIPVTLGLKTWRIYKNAKAVKCLEVKSGIIRNLKTIVGKKIHVFGHPKHLRLGS